MHELSIAESIVDIVRENLAANGSGTGKSVRVRVGELAGVVPDSLDFCFIAITNGTPLEGAKLEIEKTNIVAHCQDCGVDSKVEGLVFQCPMCESINIQVISGNELQVIEIEVDDENIIDH